MSTFPVGSKLYFPNVTLKLMRSPLPPHQAVFRCPVSMAKPDIKEYLKNLYNLQITDIRTINYPSKRVNAKRYGSAGNTSVKKGFSLGAYKKAIVTMKDDFVFPPLPDMASENAPMRLIDGISKGDKKKLLKMTRSMAAERNIDLSRRRVPGEAESGNSNAVTPTTPENETKSS